MYFSFISPVLVHVKCCDFKYRDPDSQALSPVPGEATEQGECWRKRRANYTTH